MLSMALTFGISERELKPKRNWPRATNLLIIQIQAQQTRTTKTSTKKYKNIKQKTSATKMREGKRKICITSERKNTLSKHDNDTI